MLSRALLFDKLFPNQPTPDEDNSNRQGHTSAGRKVALGTGMSCICLIVRNEIRAPITRISLIEDKTVQTRNGVLPG
jgi:hypothetical protein